MAKKKYKLIYKFYMSSESLKLNHTCLFELELQSNAVSDYGFDHSEAISSLIFFFTFSSYLDTRLVTAVNFHI